MNNKISVIIPVYNVEKYLRQCLDSVVNQTYRNLEIICVDDGSPDNCGKILDEYATKDERFIVIHQENQGQSVARNTGLDVVTGEYIMFLDSDDWLDLDLCEKTISVSIKENVDIVLYKMVRTKKRFIRGIFHPSCSQLITDNALKVQTFFRAGCSICDQLFKANLIQDNHLRFFPGIKHEDQIFGVQTTLLSNKIYFFDGPLYHYRCGGGTSSPLNTVTWYDLPRALKLVQEVAEKWTSDKVALQVVCAHRFKYYYDALISILKKPEHIKNYLTILFSYITEQEWQDLFYNKYQLKPQVYYYYRYLKLKKDGRHLASVFMYLVWIYFRAIHCFNRIIESLFFRGK